MKLAGVELEGTYKVMFNETGFVLLNQEGKVFYTQDEEGNWSKREYNEDGSLKSYENSRGFKEER